MKKMFLMCGIAAIVTGCATHTTPVNNEPLPAPNEPIVTTSAPLPHTYTYHHKAKTCCHKCHKAGCKMMNKNHCAKKACACKGCHKKGACHHKDTMTKQAVNH